jgi:formamidopyrimidine-DNA glycosylase
VEENSRFMPELPEVETMVADLAQRVVGCRILGVSAPFPGEVVYPDFPEFVERVTDREIVGISRRGKFAIFRLDSADLLIIHRGMTGSLLLRDESAPMEPYVRLVFRLDGGVEMRLDDARKFGKVYVMREDGSERPLPWARMGPEPLNGEFTRERFREELHGRSALIKPLLLNQQIVAGLGNIYVDEALFDARIHPERRANNLSVEETDRLHDAIRRVLADAVHRRGTTFSTYRDIEGRAGQYQDALRVFRKAQSPCPRCGTPLVRIVVGGRGTHLCPECQRK